MAGIALVVLQTQGDFVKNVQVQDRNPQIGHVHVVWLTQGDFAKIVQRPDRKITKIIRRKL